MQPAKRGDVILTEGESSYVSVTSGTHSQKVYSLGIVTAVTRDKNAKKYVQIKDFDHVVQYNVPITRWVASQEIIDVNALLNDMRSKIKIEWDADRFDSLENARSYLRQFLKA